MLSSISLNTFMNLGIMIFVGMAVGRLMKLVKLPNVTGYLVAGLLIGPGVYGTFLDIRKIRFDATLSRNDNVNKVIKKKVAKAKKASK